MKNIADPDRLRDFIGTVVLCAPDRFPRRDYLREEDQLDLEHAFAAINRAMAMFMRSHLSDDVGKKCQDLIDSSLAAYRAGKQREGAHLILDFRALAFSNPFPES